jgi:hypothetical protein
MRKTVLFVICNVLFFISCDRIFVHVSGKEIPLQGKWQMIDADTVYFNFQNSLFQYQIYLRKDVMAQAYGYYFIQGDTAIDLRLLREYASFSLNHLGWDTLYSASGKHDTIAKTFIIEHLSRSKLILSSNNGKLSFRRF